MPVEVELLVIPDCPNTARALDLVESALADQGLSVPVVVTVISTAEDARDRQFAGSPTILINGTDPFAQSGAGTGIACRVYPTARGLDGVPDAGQLAAALAARLRRTRR